MFIARKPCSFGGKKFFIGDVIPESLVSNPKVQEKMGVLGIVHQDNSIPAPSSEFIGKPLFEIPIVKDNETLKLELSQEQIARAASIMQMGTKEAEEQISGITDNSILIFLNACDSRKAVKTATREQAMKIDGE